MAKTKRKRKAAPRKKQQEYPGWVWMIFGLAIGLSVALAIYMKDREPDVAMRPTVADPASMASALNDSSESEVPAAEEQPERRFDFYDMLPNFEVIIPEQEPDVRHDLAPQAIEQPGNYVLQAGSFIEYGDADRRRAQLALQGIESRIQRVTIDDKTYHRVRIGLTRDLDKLTSLRNRLHQAQIDVLRIRLGD